MDKYIEIFKKIFKITDRELKVGFAFKDIEQWDSLKHLTLITALEDTFDIIFDTEDILHYSSFEYGISILKRYGVDFEE